MSESARFEVAVARSSADLMKWLAPWQDLAAHALEPNPLYEPWMMGPALAAQADEPGFTCITLWQGGRLQAMFPFRRGKRLKGLLPGPLSSWRHPSWMLCTPLVRAQSARAALCALFDWLEREDEPLAEFSYLPSDGPFYGLLADTLRARSATVVATESFSRACFRKGGAAGRLSGMQRRKLERKERRLRERGRLEHVTLAGDGDAARWVHEFLELEASGWKGRSGSALACSPGNHRFAFAALTAAHRAQRLLIHGLDLDGAPIARHCYLLAGDGCFSYRSAFDEEFAYYSPGTLAGMHAMRVLDALPGVNWVDSISDPANPTVNRLWKDRRTMRTLVVGVGAWGEFCASLLPASRWFGRRTPVQPVHV